MKMKRVDIFTVKKKVCTYVPRKSNYGWPASSVGGTLINNSSNQYSVDFNTFRVKMLYTFREPIFSHLEYFFTDSVNFHI